MLSRTASRAADLSRCADLALFEWQHDARTVGAVCARLSLLLAPDACESLTNVGVDALGVAERRIEYRFHRGSTFALCDSPLNRPQSMQESFRARAQRDASEA